MGGFLWFVLGFVAGAIAMRYLANDRYHGELTNLREALEHTYDELKGYREREKADHEARKEQN